MASTLNKLRARRYAQRPMPFKSIVAGSDLGDFYKDDNGKLWKYETKAGVPAGQVRASTDQYGGVTSPWYDRVVLFGDDHAEVNAWIDAYSPSDDSGGGSSDTSKPKPTPKPAPPKPAGGVIAKTISNAVSPSIAKKPTGWGYIALVASPASGFLFAGPAGAAVGLGVGIAALLASRK